MCVRGRQCLQAGEPVTVVTVFVRGGHPSQTVAKGQAQPSSVFTTLCFTRCWENTPTWGFVQGGAGDKAQSDERWRQGADTGKRSNFSQEWPSFNEAASSKNRSSAPITYRYR